MDENRMEFWINDDIEKYKTEVWRGLTLKQIKGALLVLVTTVISFLIMFLLFSVPAMLCTWLAIFFAIPVTLVNFVKIEEIEFIEFIDRKWYYAFNKGIFYKSELYKELEEAIDPSEEKRKKGWKFIRKKKREESDIENKEYEEYEDEDYLYEEDKDDDELDEYVSFADEEYISYTDEEETSRNDQRDKKPERIILDELPYTIRHDFERREINKEKYEKTTHQEYEDDEENDKYKEFLEENFSEKNILGELKKEELNELFFKYKPEEQEVGTSYEGEDNTSCEEKDIEESYTYSGENTMLLDEEEDIKEKKYSMIDKDGNRIFIVDGMKIGRDPSFADLIIKNKTVSGKHAVFSLKNNVLMLKDVGSKNGTYVDGKKIQIGLNVEIKAECRIKFSNEEYLVE